MFSPSLNINRSLLPLPANCEGHFGRWVVPPVVDRRRCQSFFFFPRFSSLKQLLHFSFSTCLFFHFCLQFPLFLSPAKLLLFIFFQLEHFNGHTTEPMESLFKRGDELSSLLIQLTWCREAIPRKNLLKKRI